MDLLAEYNEEFVDTVATLVGPVLILLVFGLVATLVFGIYLPLFKVVRLGVRDGCREPTNRSLDYHTVR